VIEIWSFPEVDVWCLRFFCGAESEPWSLLLQPSDFGLWTLELGLFYRISADAHQSTGACPCRSPTFRARAR
jgi:hypothetical protein